MSKFGEIFVALILNIMIIQATVTLPSDECELDGLPESGTSFVGADSEGSTKGAINLIGSVNDLLNGGLLRDWVKDKTWTLKGIGIAGLGVATLNNQWPAAGATLFINGFAISKSADNGSADYYKTRLGKEFKTQFSVFIKPEAKKDGVVKVNFKQTGGITMAAFYQSLSDLLLSQPFCFYGLAQFSVLRATALTKAPIYGEPVFQGSKASAYYANPVEEHRKEHTVVMGCAANTRDLKATDTALFELMSKILYKNPRDTTNPHLEVHSHVATLNKCLTSTEEIRPGHVKDTFHLVSDAKLNWAKFQVFLVKKAESVNEL